MKNLDGGTVGQWSQWGHYITSWPHGACDNHRPVGFIGDAPSQFGRNARQPACPMLGVMQFQPGAVATERVGQKYITAGVNRALMQPEDVMGMGLVPQLGRVT